MHYDETPETFTAQIVHFASDFGVNIVGGCCGTTPAHLKLVVEAMQRITPKARDAKLVPAASSIYFQQPYVQDASFLIVGERVNASGSKKMRDLLNAEFCRSLRPSTRGELEITDLNSVYLKEKGVAREIIGSRDGVARHRHANELARSGKLHRDDRAFTDSARPAVRKAGPSFPTPR